MSNIEQLHNERFTKFRECSNYSGNKLDCEYDPRCIYRTKTNKCRFRKFKKMELDGINTPNKKLIINKYKSLLYDNLFYNEYTLLLYGYYLLLKYFNKTHAVKMQINDNISKYDKYSYDNDDLLNFYRILEYDRKTMIIKIIKEISQNIDVMKLIQLIENSSDSVESMNINNNGDVSDLLIDKNDLYVYRDLDKYKLPDCNIYNNNQIECGNDDRCVYRSKNNQCMYKKNQRLKQYDKPTINELNRMYMKKSQTIDNLFKNGSSIKTFMYTIIYYVYDKSKLNNQKQNFQILENFVKNVKNRVENQSIYNISKNNMSKLISNDYGFRNIVKIINNIDPAQSDEFDIYDVRFDLDYDSDFGFDSEFDSEFDSK